MLHAMTPIKADEQEIPDVPAPHVDLPAALRWLLIAAGWLLIAIGIVGIVVPVLPTTVFLIGALWAFSRSSRRFQVWLWTHPRLGPPVRAWHLHGVIPKRGKFAAVTLMSLSFAYVSIWVASDWRLPATMAVVMVPAAIYVVTRPSYPSAVSD